MNRKIKLMVFIFLIVIISTFVLIAIVSLRPRITSHEFSYELVYSVDGIQNVKKGTIKCKFDGYGWSSGDGFFRKWTSNFDSGENCIFLKEIKNTDSLLEPNKIVSTQKIYFFLGSNSYYMGEPNEEENSGFLIEEEISEKLKQKTIISIEKLPSKKGVEIVSWEMDERIINHFK